MDRSAWQIFGMCAAGLAVLALAVWAFRATVHAPVTCVESAIVIQKDGVGGIECPGGSHVERPDDRTFLCVCGRRK